MTTQLPLQNLNNEINNNNTKNPKHKVKKDEENNVFKVYHANF